VMRKFDFRECVVSVIQMSCLVVLWREVVGCGSKSTLDPACAWCCMCVVSTVVVVFCLGVWVCVGVLVLWWWDSGRVLVVMGSVVMRGGKLGVVALLVCWMWETEILLSFFLSVVFCGLWICVE